MNRADHCLQLDVGNSSAKWRLMRDGEIAARGRYRADDSGSLKDLLSCSDTLQQIWISSVAGEQRNGALSSLLEDRWGVMPWFARSTAQIGSLRNSYNEPERLGVDRWLAMLGAQIHLPGRFAVVDAGSALTIDIVAADGQHEGGYIMPGAELMERALLLDTDRVRFEEQAEYRLDPGKSTAEAVRCGIAASQVGAVCLVLERLGLRGDDLLFCGGGAQQLIFLSDLGGSWLPDLIFEGLELAAAQR
ncbi:MAG: type III pantothenate kinase [Halioglobus sp.]|jgi:type III pantothenate kinase